MSEPIDDGIEDCPSCKGTRYELVDGEAVVCTNCNGSGLAITPPPGETYEGD